MEDHTQEWRATAERDRLIASVMSDIVETELHAADRPSDVTGTRPTGRIVMPDKSFGSIA